MGEIEAKIAVPRPLGVAALIVAAVMLWLWLGRGSVGTQPLPIERVPDAALVEGDWQPDEVPPSDLSSPEADPVRRVQLKEPSPRSGDFSAAAVMGRVFDPDGHLVAGAVVALLVLGPKGPDEELLAHVVSDPDGSFVLEPLAAMRGRDLALIARRDGYRPASIPFRLDAEFQRHDHDLHLERGYSIEGRIVRKGQPVAGTSVDVDLRWMVSGVHGIGSEAFWIDGRLEEKIARTRSDASGRFRFAGLGPYQHRLHVVPRSNEGALEHEERVPAPSMNLEVDISSAEMEITVRRFGMPASGVWILASSAHRKVEVLSNRKQPTVLEYLPGEEVQLSFHDDRSELLEKTVKAPTKGSRSFLTVDLVPAERPALEIHMPGARARGIERIEARLIGETNGIDTARLLVLRPLDERFLWAAVPLPPGPYRLVIGPRRSTSGHHLLESSQRIVLPTEGLLEAEVALRRGGLFELDLRPRVGRDSSIKAWLVEDSGSKVWGRTWEYSDAIIWSTAIGLGGAPMGHVTPVPTAHRHQESSDHVLVPAKYRLLVEADGQAVVDREVEIRAGETTKERVQL